MQRASLRKVCALAGLLVFAGYSAGCGNDGGATMQLQSCPANYQTCQGASDCVSACVCEGSQLASCEQRCGDGDKGGPYVGALDESEWSEDWEAFEREVLERSNAARAKGGCCGDEGCFGASPALELEPKLERSARSHARDMGRAMYFNHVSEDGRSPFDRMREAGFRGCAMGENIAAGQPTPSSVMDDWLKSPGHCKNILEPSFEQLGVGYYELDGQSVWVQNFGG
ncbi:MAG TPA: CAP domain-containing protein [Polyangiales bacterium]|nr:CAP domain-containing protein [Polyangiales bacterium]